MKDGLARLRAHVLSWLRPRSLDEQVGEELAFHVDRETEANIERGMNEAEARRKALLSIGSLDATVESSRDGRPGAFLRQVLRDLAHGLRLLAKAPGFSATAVLIVALATGAVTSLFSVVHGVVLRPLPYREPERLVSLWTKAPRLRLPRALVGAADHAEWRAQNRVLEDIALVRPVANFNLSGDGDPERLQGARLSPSLFTVLGVGAMAGRVFLPEESEVGKERVALLSHGLWQRRFGGDPGVVGRSILLSGTPHTVVGVMPESFRYPSASFEIWTPLTINPAELTRKEKPYNYRAIGRLRPGVTLAQAQADLEAIAVRLEAAYPATNREIGVEVAGMLEDETRAVRPALFALFGAAVCLVLVACLNLANLLGARGAARQREFALRLALGASRGRLIVQAVAETVPLLVLGGASGVVLAAGALRAFRAAAPTGLPRVESIALDGVALAFTGLVLAATGLLASLLPAAQAWSTDLRAATRADARTAGSRTSTRLRRVLVAAEIALTMPLLVGANLLLRSFASLSEVDPGFQTANVASFNLAIPRSKYDDDAKVAAFCSRVIEEAAAVPGVLSVGMVNRLPLGGVGQIGTLEVEKPEAGDGRVPSVDWRSVTPSYFATLRIPLLEGRDFTDHDDLGTTPVGIVDEQLARALWPSGSAIGRRFRIPSGDLPWVEIVGVVGHLRHEGLDVDVRPQVYWPHRQRAQDRMGLVARTTGDPGAATREIVAAVRRVDPEQAVYDVRPMTEVVERSMAPRRLSVMLLSAFAVIALVLASVGLYGVVAFGAARRVREFGVRMAMGASRSDVGRLVVFEGLGTASLGALAGLLIALAFGGLVEGLLFGVTPRDIGSLAGAIAVLLAVVLLASYLPARRASALDPSAALRCD